MEPSTFSSLLNIVYMVGGFFDFVVFVGLLVVALTSVRKVDRGLGTGMAVLAIARFGCILLSRVVSAVFNPMPFHDMNGAIPIVTVLLTVAIHLVDLALWGVVLLTLSRLATRLAR